MNTLTLAQPALFGEESALDEATLFRPLGGEPTLDDEIVRVWEGLTAQRAVVCPLCQGEMALAPAGRAGSRLRGRCGSCGSTLS